MRYGADDLTARGTNWALIAQEHMEIAQDILADHVIRENPSAHRGAIALAQAHSIQALALIEGWSK